MSSGRYYFPELPEDDALCVIANLSKQMLREGEQIVEILRKNYSILYEQSPRNISFLMEESNKSIFDLSPNTSEIVKQQKGNISSMEQSSEHMSTPVSRISCLPRKYLSIDEAEKECTDTETTDTSQKRTICHKDVHIAIPNPSDDESATANKVVVTPSTSKSPKSTGSPHAEDEDSPRSAQTVAIFTNLNLKEKESPELAKTNKTTHIPAANAQISGSPRQITKNYQPSADLNEEKQTSNLITKIKHIPSPIKKSKISDDPATNIQVFVSPTEKSYSTQDTKLLDLSIKGNKMRSSPIKWNKSVEVAEVKRKLPSPRSDTLFSTVTPKIICSIRMKEFDIELPWESDKNSSPRTRRNLSRDFKADETVKSSKGEIDNLKDNIKSSELFESKGKTSPKITDPQLSPCEKNTCSGSPTSQINAISPRGKENQDPVKSISPPVVPSKIVVSPKSVEHHISPLKENIFESPHNLIKVTSPDTGKECFRILDLSPISKPLSAAVSPKTMECELSHSEKQACIGFPQNTTEIDSSSEDTDYASKKPSSPSTSSHDAMLPDDVGSCSAKLKTIENSDYTIINSFRNKLTRLISVRDDYMSEIFENFSKFQKELHFLFIFIKKIVYLVKKLQAEGKEYVTNEFENLASELTTRAFKLAENLSLWKSSGDSEVQTWIQYFSEIKHLKSNHETRINSITSPVNCLRILREYEKNLKSVWKKMIDMKNVEDARRSSLINSSFEFEMLTKQFVKCLIIVGIVKPRSETAFT